MLLGGHPNKEASASSQASMIAWKTAPCFFLAVLSPPNAGMLLHSSHRISSHWCPKSCACGVVQCASCSKETAVSGFSDYFPWQAVFHPAVPLVVWQGSFWCLVGASICMESYPGKGWKHLEDIQFCLFLFCRLAFIYVPPRHKEGFCVFPQEAEAMTEV